jgi:hypothetical protein
MWQKVQTHSSCLFKGRIPVVSDSRIATFFAGNGSAFLDISQSLVN